MPNVVMHIEVLQLVAIQKQPGLYSNLMSNYQFSQNWLNKKHWNMTYNMYLKKNISME
jgi:hypothetical protein